MAFGEDDEGEDEGHLVAGYGIRRILDPGTTYVEQPDVAEVPRWVEKPGSKHRVYDMEWPGESQPETFTLLNLYERIAPQRKKLTEDNDDLASVDACIAQLVDAVGRLHAGGSSVGFLQPDSVQFLHRHDGTCSAVLPDVGFAWDDAGGLLEPEWLARPECG